MKKILILANNDVGLYKFRKELIQELLKKYEVYISLPYGEFIPELIKMGCHFIDTPVDRRGMNPFALTHRLRFSLLLLAGYTLTTAEMEAQERKEEIRLEVTQKPLSQVFRQLEKSTDYKFNLCSSRN